VATATAKTTRTKRKMNDHNKKRKKRILLVDDEPDTCLFYQIVLEDVGFECIPYTDSVKALQELTLLS
jgi:CheY-like chemotaxis protein